MGSVLVLTDCH